MKKKRWITLIIVILIVGAGTTYFLFYKQQTCQDFIDECYKQNFEFYAGGGHIYTDYPDGSSSSDYKAKCPQDCSRYTEEHGYFKNKIRQKIYFYNKVKECKKQYEKCIQDKTGRCHECDKYGQERHFWN